MKKLYIICFITLSCLFAGCYFLGYFAIVQHHEERVPVKDYYEVRLAAAGQEELVRRETYLVIEEYDIEDGFMDQHISVPGIDILGLDRVSYANRLEKYMESPDEEDIKKGLVSVDLMEFSSKRIVVRKTYDTPRYSKDSNFILYALDGKVIIYYEDFVTIYDYTDIDVTKLPLDLQRQVYVGMQVQTLEELYAFLEEYTS